MNQTLEVSRKEIGLINTYKMKKILTILLMFLSSLLYSQTVCTDTIFAPNAFTPTLTTNNKFIPYINYYTDYQMVIYNRWGYLIYSGKEWDGTYKGTLCQQTTYIWEIKAYGSECERNFRGMVVLIR